jgi:UDP-N-acetylglucosamine--N-acetylmuramyl-(pentapeptide) pyrophosphoryl-undecaprenol N-acetylglucosamine transferase
LAEFAAAGVPSVLIPFPASMDDHQRFNARAMERAGAAEVLDQGEATPERLVEVLGRTLDDEDARGRRVRAAMSLHRPDAARRMAERLLALAWGRRRGGAEAGASAARAAEGLP